MTDKITLTNLVNLENETTAVNAINANNAVITSAFDNTLSLDGTAPNQMGANLDMNNNQILNLPAPVSNFNPLRLIDATTLGTGGTVTVNPLPSGGTTGQVLAKNSGTNFDTSWETIGSVASGGTTNQVLAKNSNTNFDTKWENVVTSVGVTAPADFTITNTPITTTGNIGVAWANTPTGTGSVVRQTSPTLTTPQIAQITNSGNTMTVPTANDTFVGRNTIDVLTNKNIAATQLTGTIPATNMPAFAGDVVVSSGSLTTAISANAVTNGQLSPMAAFTLKGNATNASANPTDISIPALTQKVSPVSGDMLMIVDSAASNALKFATVSSVATAGSVSSLGGTTGAITLGSGLNMASNVLQDDPAMIGEVRQIAFNRVPANFLACNGAAVSRGSFATLFAALVVSGVATITNASPAVVTITGNSLQNGDPIFFTTTGTLPTGLSLATKYFVKGVSGSTFNVSATPGGTNINTTGAGSGTHTGVNAPWEGTAVGNGTTTFTLPNLNGQFIRGIDNGTAVDTNRSFGTNQAHQFQTHGHSASSSIPVASSNVGGQIRAAEFDNASGNNITTSVITVGAPNSGNTGSETRPVNQTLLYVIRYQ